MNVSRFFCQNLLSDYHEKLLPPGRQAEVKKWLETDAESQRIHRDLVSTVKLLNAMPLHDISNDMALRIMEAAEAVRGKRRLGVRVVQVLLVLLVPLSIVTAVALVFPKSVPAVSRMLASTSGSSSQFVRFYPLYHGAEEVLDAQSAVIGQVESLAGSVWEEGGMSPEEFEKTFSLQGATSNESNEQ